MSTISTYLRHSHVITLTPMPEDLLSLEPVGLTISFTHRFLLKLYVYLCTCVLLPVELLLVVVRSIIGSKQGNEFNGVRCDVDVLKPVLLESNDRRR